MKNTFSMLLISLFGFIIGFLMLRFMFVSLIMKDEFDFSTELIKSVLLAVGVVVVITLFQEYQSWQKRKNQNNW